MKVTVLVENERSQANDQLKSRHGLSLLIHHNNRRILFDTGPGKALLANAQQLAIDLGEVDDVVISHGHSDHIGGLRYLECLSSETKVYLAERALADHWLKVGPLYKKISLKEQRLAHLRDHIQLIQEETQLGPGIHLIMCQEIPAAKRQRAGNKNLFTGSSKQPDSFEHELILVIEEPEGLVVFTGCSHSGLVNILELVKARFATPIKAVVGGFHLIGLPYLNNLGVPRSTVEKLALELLTLEVGTFYSCHCTGRKAFAIMKPILGDSLVGIQTGTEIEID